MSKFIGIDFSGGARPWRLSVAVPTVWIAIVEESGGGLVLEDLFPVQELKGVGSPFDRLIIFLLSTQFEAAAIDAPFSLPASHLPPGGHSELLRRVQALPDGIGRPFPSGASIVALGEEVAPKVQPKPLRQTEAYWKGRGVNTRSTMWIKPRGGAPFAAACLRLIERSQLPCWPWSAFQPGILGEAFPAAQLRQWGLPYRKYSDRSARTARDTILIGLRERVRVNSLHAQIMLESADALDAVIASFAAIAIAKNAVPGYASYEDGFIAVAE